MKPAADTIRAPMHEGTDRKVAATSSQQSVALLDVCLVEMCPGAWLKNRDRQQRSIAIYDRNIRSRYTISRYTITIYDDDIRSRYYIIYRDGGSEICDERRSPEIVMKS